MKEGNESKPRTDLNTLSIHQYLDKTVVPLLVQALTALSKERPPDPIKYLADYLINNKAKFETASNSQIADNDRPPKVKTEK